MSARRSIEQHAAMQCDKNDAWGERRETDPFLRAVINVLCEHTEVSYYTVDWRPFLFGATCPAEEDGLARGLVQDPDDIRGSHSVPYNEGGGGYLERFAWAPRPRRRARRSRRRSSTSCARPMSAVRPIPNGASAVRAVATCQLTTR